MKTTEALSLAAALLLLTGCSYTARVRRQPAAPPPPPQNSRADAPPSPQTPAQPSASAARPAVPPESVVSDLYRQHDAERSPFFQTTDRARVDRYFDKSLADLIWKDAVASQGEVGALGADPLYNAQDTEIKNFSVRTIKQDGDRAEVAATFENFGEKQRIVFRLVAAGANWKIAEIDYGGGTTLSKLLKQ